MNSILLNSKYIDSLKEKYFSNNKSVKLFIALSDGTIVYPKESNSLKNSNIGALAAGVWLASSELSKNSFSNTNISCRYSFDSSDSGIQILPLHTLERTNFLILVFENITNPGWLKNQFRLLQQNLSEQSILNQSTKKESKSELLFNNITDDEINGLFSNLGI